MGRDALAYAQAHGRDEDLEKAGREEVKAWRKNLTCTQDELTLATYFIESQGDSDEMPKDTTGDAPSAGQLVVLMHSLHGGDVAMWERYVSLGYVVDMLTTSAMQSSAEGKRIKHPERSCKYRSCLRIAQNSKSEKRSK